MHNFIGVWIDHAHAHILQANKIGEVSLVKTLHSDVEPHHLSTGTEGVHHDERRHNQMSAFCKEVLAEVEKLHMSELVIFGPSTGKHDFKREVESHKALSGMLKGVETTAKLEEAEMKDFVKKFFHLPLA